MVSPRQVVCFSIGLAGSDQFSATNRRVIAVAPDGAHVAFVAGARLYLRALDQPDAREIEGTQGGELVQGQNPFFSPDSKWIGFWQGNALKKVSVTGGAPVVICAARRVFGASWGANDRIVFGQGPAGISRVAAWGGTPETLVQVQPDQSAGWPEVLPDGRTLLFTLTTGNLWDRAQIVVQILSRRARETFCLKGAMRAMCRLDTCGTV